MKNYLFLIALAIATPTIMAMELSSDEETENAPQEEVTYKYNVSRTQPQSRTGISTFNVLGPKHLTPLKELKFKTLKELKAEKRAQEEAEAQKARQKEIQLSPSDEQMDKELKFNPNKKFNPKDEEEE